MIPGYQKFHRTHASFMRRHCLEEGYTLFIQSNTEFQRNGINETKVRKDHKFLKHSELAIRNHTKILGHLRDWRELWLPCRKKYWKRRGNYGKDKGSPKKACSLLIWARPTLFQTNLVLGYSLPLPLLFKLFLPKLPQSCPVSYKDEGWNE